MSDKPNIDLVIADLEKETKAPEPFVAVLPGGSRITFKDPFDFKMSERHDILEEYAAVQRGQGDDYDFLVKVMTKTDFEKYKKADLSIRTHNAVISRYMHHFQQGLGE